MLLITLPLTRAMFIPLPTLFFTLLINLKQTKDGQSAVVSERKHTPWSHIYDRFGMKAVPGKC